MKQAPAAAFFMSFCHCRDALTSQSYRQMQSFGRATYRGTTMQSNFFSEQKSLAEVATRRTQATDGVHVQLEFSPSEQRRLKRCRADPCHISVSSVECSPSR